MLIDPGTKRPAESKIVGVDFYCGIGGATRGFLDAGVDIVFGADTDRTAKKTYEHNNRRPNGLPSRFLCADIGKLVARRHAIRCDRNGKALVFIGCPPCQPFTNLKTKKHNQGNSKNLLLTFLDVIRLFKPEYVVAENVPGIRAEKYGGIFGQFLKGLTDEGYCYDYRVLDGKRFGIPQTRRRMVLIASRLGEIRLPRETNGPGTEQEYVPASEAFRFPPISAGESHSEIPNHRAASLSEKNLRRIHAVPGPGKGRESWPEELQLDCYRKDGCGHSDVYGRMALDKPAPTLTTRFNSLSNGRFGHPTEDRAISIREGAALQTFPDDYVFLTSFSGNARHIGNAVPVLLATVLAQTISGHYEQYLKRDANVQANTKALRHQERPENVAV